MKKTTLFIFVLMFLVHNVAVSAWAKPCLMKASVEMFDDMPCHGDKNEKQQTHCEGVCLCVHVSVSQTPIMNDVEKGNMPILSSQRLVVSNEEIMASRIMSPPDRPPIPYS